MRIFTAFTGLAITAVTAGAAVTSLTLAPAGPATSTNVDLLAFLSAAGPMLSHECPDCGGSDHCKHCIGTGAAGGNPNSNKSCHGCGGTGTCQSCLEPEPLRVIPGGNN